MPSRFELVDELPPDAMALMLNRDSESGAGRLFCPAAITANRLPKDFRSSEMALKDAFRAAIKFANDFKVPMVVHDPDGLWQAEWGTLYRNEDDVEASA